MLVMFPVFFHRNMHARPCSLSVTAGGRRTSHRLLQQALRAAGVLCRGAERTICPTHRVERAATHNHSQRGGGLFLFHNRSAVATVKLFAAFFVSDLLGFVENFFVNKN